MCLDAGPRSCPGESLAKMELFIFFTSMLQAFKLDLPEGAPTPSLQPTVGLNMSPQEYRICATHRWYKATAHTSLCAVLLVNTHWLLQHRLLQANGWTERLMSCAIIMCYTVKFSTSIAWSILIIHAWRCVRYVKACPTCHQAETNRRVLYIHIRNMMVYVFWARNQSAIWSLYRYSTCMTL